MRAMLCTEFKGADALKLGEAPDPIPATDEILIDVRAAAVSCLTSEWPEDWPHAYQWASLGPMCCP